MRVSCEFSRKASVMVILGSILASFWYKSASQNKQSIFRTRDWGSILSQVDDFRKADDNTHQYVDGAPVSSEGHLSLVPRHRFYYSSGPHTQDQEDNVHRLTRDTARTSFTSADRKLSDFQNNDEGDIENSDLQVKYVCAALILNCAGIGQFTIQLETVCRLSTAARHMREMSKSQAQRRN